MFRQNQCSQPVAADVGGDAEHGTCDVFCFILCEGYYFTLDSARALCRRHALCQEETLNNDKKTLAVWRKIQHGSQGGHSGGFESGRNAITVADLDVKCHFGAAPLCPAALSAAASVETPAASR